MIVQPKIRGFICVTAHPKGCEENVKQQISYVKGKGHIDGMPKNVLVIGASTGYGFSSRVVTAFAGGSNTIGVFFERPSADDKPASAGWYNTQAFTKFAHESGLIAENINGDAFSDDVKEQTIDLIKKTVGKVDCVIYSLAAPRRTDPFSGITYKSCLKTVGESFTSKSLNTDKGEVCEVTIEPASPEEIEGTVKVMGGEDWELWMQALRNSDVLENGARTVAYSYIGPEMTWPIYKDGTIGNAKEDLYRACSSINNMLEDVDCKAFVSVNKAVVTQASSAIPVVPLYIALLFKVMKAKGLHEGCIEQMYRLFADNVYGKQTPNLDEECHIRLDDYEMREDVQEEVKNLWTEVSTENLENISDFEGYKSEFLKLFGFGIDSVDYSKDVEI